MLGKNEIAKMKKLGNKAFKFISNASMMDIIKQATKGIEEGLKNSNLNWKAIAKNYLLPGVS